MRRLVVSIAVILSIIYTGTSLSEIAAQPQQSASITLTPDCGVGGTRVVVRGEGFIPGDVVYIDLMGPLEGSRLATATPGPDGRFAVSIVIPVGVFPEPQRIIAYPESFGGRSEETVARAPRAFFTVTDSGAPASGAGSLGLPRTGVSHQDGLDRYAPALPVVIVALAVAAAVVSGAGRRPPAVSVALGSFVQTEMTPALPLCGAPVEA